ncbi:MAG: Holliday junction resolvase RuvX [Fusobacteria bacterium]|nr:Holliday junction resolvase RuvX [Fusobacteriota bacterium]
MKYLGIDYGEKRIGLAVSDLTNTIATSYKYIINNKSKLANLNNIVKELNISHIVIGLPLLLNGQKGEKAVIVEEFAKNLANEVGANIEIIFEDERLTTVSAERILLEGDVSRKKRKGKIDALAATLILQKHLDRF